MVERRGSDEDDWRNRNKHQFRRKEWKRKKENLREKKGRIPVVVLLNVLLKEEMKKRCGG